jgi:hypothetical protein
MRRLGFTKNEKGIALFSDMKTRSLPGELSQLDKVECFLYLINKQKDEKGNVVALPALHKPAPDQELFWKKILKLCGERLFKIKDLYHLQVVVAKSNIVIEENIYQDGILFLIGQPIVCEIKDLEKIDPEFANDLQYFAAAIKTYPRGKSPVIVS